VEEEGDGGGRREGPGGGEWERGGGGEREGGRREIFLEERFQAATTCHYLSEPGVCD
jgi:hypothetical protein